MDTPVEDKPTDGISMLDSLSVQQLEALLIQKRLKEELPERDGALNMIMGTRGDNPQAVGPTINIQIEICGVPVEAMLDTGAQSTIISRELIHKVVRHIRSQGQTVPALQLPTVRLYGKDGVEGGREIVVTAQLDPEVSVDGESTNVPVFVPPESSQHCWA